MKAWAHANPELFCAAMWLAMPAIVLIGYAISWLVAP